MEKRLLLAIVLSFLVLVLYQILFVKKPPTPDQAAQSIREAEKKPPLEVIPKTPSSPLPTSKAEEPPEEKPSQPISEEKEESIIVDTSLFQALWSNKGGVLKSWKLKKYKDENMENLELVSSRSQDINIYPFFLLTDDPSFDDSINGVLYNFSETKLELNQGKKGELRFQYADAQGNRVEKVFLFQDGKYTFDVTLNVWKNGQKIEPALLWGPSLGNPAPEFEKKRFGGGRGAAVYVAKKVHRMDEKRYKPETSFFNFATWAAYENNYFTALFLTSPQKSHTAFLKIDTEETSSFCLSVDFAQKAYLGPKDFDDLGEFGHGATNLIRFGFFGLIAQILLRAIKFIHSAIPNWGFCIIVLTIIIKIIFFPLTYSSTRSMARMQELQPKIKALRAKYKKAKKDIAQRRKMNEEMMKLYKEHGINPAGGCLPMLVQIPIFWGFFRLLVVSIEFRQSPFIFWIKDLSLKDPFYVTPILMGVTQFISQKMTPTSADPTQQKMMLIMPVIMTIFFMNFQSGLVLYWLTNNMLQIGQQYIMNRLMKKKKKESHGRKRRKK